MGDRRNVVVTGRGSRVFLFTHADGTELPRVVQEVLRRKQRWTDPAYLGRMLFQGMVGGDQSELGYGVSSVQQNSNHDDVLVDTDKQEVTIGARTWTFEKFCTARLGGG